MSRTLRDRCNSQASATDIGVETQDGPPSSAGQIRPPPAEYKIIYTQDLTLPTGSLGMVRR